jgi:hypothetical protein
LPVEWMAAMEEDQVDREVAVTDLHRVLRAYDGEVTSQLGSARGPRTRWRRRP